MSIVKSLAQALGCFRVSYTFALGLFSPQLLHASIHRAAHNTVGNYFCSLGFDIAYQDTTTCIVILSPAQTTFDSCIGSRHTPMMEKSPSPNKVVHMIVSSLASSLAFKR